MEEDVPPIDALICKAHSDRESLGGLLEWYRGMVLVWAYRNLDAGLQRRCDPEDLVQDVLAKAVKGFAQFRGTTAREFTAWIGTIFQNAVRDKVRTLSFAEQGMPQGLAAHGGDTSTNLPAFDPPDDQTGPGRKLIRGDQAFRAARALAALPAAQRKAVCLRIFEDLPFKDIAVHMGRSVTAVTGLYRRGIEALRENLGDSSMA